jgi:hypothetical protein
MQEFRLDELRRMFFGKGNGSYFRQITREIKYRLIVLNFCMIADRKIKILILEAIINGHNLHETGLVYQ